MNFGTAVDDVALQNEPDYRAVLGDQFNMVEPEDVMKWGVIHPAPDLYDFSGADRLVDFAAAHHMIVRGHNLAWWMQNPDWLQHGQFTRREAIILLRDHILTVVGRYRGRIAQWDVVNEAIDSLGRPTDNPWLRSIGPEYLALAFRFARFADPSARLYYNDFVDVPAKFDRMLDLVVFLRALGVPIDGIGVQFHVLLGGVNKDVVADQMRRAAAAGIHYAITELDVGLPTPPTSVQLLQQADVMQTLLRTCLESTSCDTFNLWGFTDRHSWIPSFFPGLGAATPFDEMLRPKPAWVALTNTLSG